MFGGKIRGAYQFFITQKILDAVGAEKLPRYFRILKNARDLKDQWYSWEGFCQLLTEVAELTSEDQLRSIGVKTMMALKDGFVSAGFTSLDAVIQNYNPLLKKNTKQMKALELPKTLQFEPGFALIEMSASRPKALIEGYLIGLVQMFGRQVISIKAEPIRRGDFSGYKYELRWQ